ncbi:MAG: immunoglobulin domain-containing protein, partial [Verrucomicrobiota bacterium]
ITTVAGNGGTNDFGDGGAATNASLHAPASLTVDGSGNLFIADTGNNCVREVGTNGLITTVAGDGSAGYSGDGGVATNATLDAPAGVAVDGSGNLFIADTGNNCVREVGTNGLITTVTGDGEAGYSGDGGVATNAALDAPSSVAVDGSGNLFIADTGNNCIREVGANGLIATVAGNGSPGYSGDGGVATNGTLVAPTGSAVDGSGNLFIADTGNNCIREVGANGLITTVAGNGSPGYSGDGGVATNGTLVAPTGIAVDGSGNLFIADTGNNAIRKVDTNGVIKTVAGDGSAGYSGDGGLATSATLNAPASVAVDDSGNLFIADTDNNRIREVVPGSPTFTLNDVSANGAGNYTVIIANAWGSVTSSVATVTVALPPAITGQPAGLTVTNGNPASFGVTASGTAPLVCRWQKNGMNLTDGGSLSGSATTNLFLSSTTTNDAGNYAVIIANAWGSVTSRVASLTIVVPPPMVTQQPTNQTVVVGGTATLGVLILSAGPCTYQWQLNGTNLPDDVITTVAGDGAAGDSGDGGVATNASLNAPAGVAVDGSGNLLIADTGNNSIREVGANGFITTVAGVGSAGNSGNGGLATNASLAAPAGVAVDAAGNLFVANISNNRVCEVATNGLITTVAGDGSPGGAIADGIITNASLSYPSGVAVDAAGNLFIADRGNNRIQKMSASGLITTVAGDGSPGYSGDGGLATQASLDAPAGVALDGSGNLFIADTGNNSIREVGANGLITTVAGDGSPGYSGDGGVATNATLDAPVGVAVDASGNLFIADTDNNTIREVDTNGVITTVAGDGSPGYSGDGGLANNASLDAPASVTLDGSGNLFIADTDNNRIREVVPGSPTFTLNSVSANDAGDYTVIIANAWGSVTSSVAVVTVALPPAITGQPEGLTVTNGNPASFGVTVSGTAPLVCRWQKNGADLTDGGNLSGSATTSLLLSSTTTNDAGNYTVIITNAWGSVTSSVALLTVVLPPVITGQPQSLTVTNGNSASFAVTASGTAPLSYRWQNNGTDLTDGGGLSGSTTAHLFLISTAPNEAGDYTVVIASAWGSVTSSVASLTIVIPPTVIAQQPTSQTVVTGGTASFSVTASGTGPFGYQWIFNGTILSGASNASLVLNNVQPSQAGTYAVLITNMLGSFLSSNATLTVLTPPMILVQPTNQVVIVGSTASFSVTAGGTGPLSYQWIFNGTNLSRGTNASLVLRNVQPSKAGTYAVLVSNLAGSILASNAVLTVTLDHFTWGQISTPQFVHTPFSVTIQAQNMTNGIFTNFTGIAILDSTNGVALSPALSGNFIQGCWTGTVSIARTATNLVLRASDGLGHFGLANPINVVALPPLTSQISGGTLLLRWPVSSSGFVLESSGSLAPAAWTVVPVSPIQIGSQYLIPLRLPGTNCFYRLSLSGQ